MRLIFGLIIACIIGVSGFQLYEMQKLSDATESLYNQPMVVGNNVREIKADVLEIERHIIEVIYSKDKDKTSSSQTRIEELEENIDRLIDGVYKNFTGSRFRVQDAVNYIEDWKDIRDQIIELAKDEDFDGAIEMHLEENTEHIEDMNKQLNKLIDLSNSSAEEFISISRQERNKSIFFSAIAIATLILATFLLSFFLERTIIKPIKRIASIIKNLAHADFSQCIQIKTKDELGELSSDIDTMIANLSQIFSLIQQKSDDISTSSSNLKQLSGELVNKSVDVKTQSEDAANATEQVSTNITTMAATAEQMSVNTAGVSSAAEEMSTNMNTITQSVGHLTSIIQEIATKAEETLSVSTQANERSKSSQKAMGELDEAAVQIGDVTNVIKRIAEQTNLLALNATIEAASAGEAGKGFAVVANEIKELANQSAKAAEDISSRIEGVQTNTQHAIRSINEISEVIQKATDSVRFISESVQKQSGLATSIDENIQQANIGINDIANSISEMAKAAENVSSTAGEAAKTSQEVTGNIHVVHKSAENSNENAQQVEKTSAQLAEIGTSLEESVKGFKFAA